MQVTPLEFIIAPYVLEQQFSNLAPDTLQKKAKILLIAIEKRIVITPR